MITGKDLIDLGFKPGKWFKEAIAMANSRGISGPELLDFLTEQSPKYITQREIPALYHKNIKAKTAEEVVNLVAVEASMKALMYGPTVKIGAIMPDACPTGVGEIPVGGIIATENAIHPAMHSADICCSVMMTNYGKANPLEILNRAYSKTHFGWGGRKEFSDLPSDLLAMIKTNQFTRDLEKIAIEHMGTQGDGNHFLFVGLSKATGDTMLVTHHGSRGFGAGVYKHGLKVAEQFRKEIAPLCPDNNPWIPYDTVEGKGYWEALQIVRAWTKQNHEVLHDSIYPENNGRIWNEHNFVFKSADLFYHAKGATPLDPKFVPDSKDGLRLIPLNMGQPILVVKGKTWNNNLGFAPHGAGRNTSRAEHKRRQGNRSIEEIFYEETKDLDVRFYSGNIDTSELPSAYKDANTVREQMKTFNLGEVVDEILPYGCIMAGHFPKPWHKKKK